MKGFLESLHQGLQKNFRPVVLISTKDGIGKGNCGVREHDRRALRQTSGHLNNDSGTPIF
jgi:hypothetical protein